MADKHDLQALHEVCDQAIAFHWGALGDGRGLSELQRMEEHARAAFPDLAVESEWMLAEGDIVVHRPRVTGTHGGPWFGVAPTGKRAAWTAMESYRIANGKIVEQWLNEDWASVLQQLGALPEA